MNSSELRRICFMIIGLSCVSAVNAMTIGDQFGVDMDIHTYVHGQFNVWGMVSPADITINLAWGNGDWIYRGIVTKAHPLSGAAIRVHRFEMRQGGGFTECSCETISEVLECYGGGTAGGEWWLDETTLNPVYFTLGCGINDCFWGNGYIVGGFQIEIAFDPFLDSMRTGIPPGMGWEQDLGVWVRNHLDIYDQEQQWWAYGTAELETDVNGVLFMQETESFPICSDNPVLFRAGIEEYEVETGWCPDIFFSHATMQHQRSTSYLDIDLLTQSVQIATPTPPPTPTQTPSAPPDPTWTPEPTATPTAVGCEESGVQLENTVEVLVPGIRWNLDAVVCNSGSVAIVGFPLHVVIEYAGEYYFGPSFSTAYDSYLEGYPEFPAGESIVSVIEGIEWPEGVGEGTCRFFGVMLMADRLSVWGEWDEMSVSWIE